MIEYLFQCHGVVCLLIHVITECLPKCVCAYAVNTKRAGGGRQNIIGLLARDRLVWIAGRFEQIFIIFFVLHILIQNCNQFIIQGKTLFFPGLLLTKIDRILSAYIPDAENQNVRNPKARIYPERPTYP